MSADTNVIELLAFSRRKRQACVLGKHRWYPAMCEGAGPREMSTSQMNGQVVYGHRLARCEDCGGIGVACHDRSRHVALRRGWDAAPWRVWGHPDGTCSIDVRPKARLDEEGQRALASAMNWIGRHIDAAVNQETGRDAWQFISWDHGYVIGSVYEGTVKIAVVVEKFFPRADFMCRACRTNMPGGVKAWRGTSATPPRRTATREPGWLRADDWRHIRFCAACVEPRTEAT